MACSLIIRVTMSPGRRRMMEKTSRMIRAIAGTSNITRRST
jgi:hypothetical protein